jgi:DNA-binding PadR family transcriptional regulator
VYSLTAKGNRAVHEWLKEGSELFDLRDEGLLKLFFGEILEPDELLTLVKRRRSWFEEYARRFRKLSEELGPIDDPSGEVLRYGIELMNWNAARFAALEQRLTRPG